MSLITVFVVAFPLIVGTTFLVAWGVRFSLRARGVGLDLAFRPDLSGVAAYTEASVRVLEAIRPWIPKARALYAYDLDEDENAFLLISQWESEPDVPPDGSGLDAPEMPPVELTLPSDLVQLRQRVRTQGDDLYLDLFFADGAFLVRALLPRLVQPSPALRMRLQEAARVSSPVVSAIRLTHRTTTARDAQMALLEAQGALSSAQGPVEQSVGAILALGGGLLHSQEAVAVAEGPRGSRSVARGARAAAFARRLASLEDPSLLRLPQAPDRVNTALVGDGDSQANPVVRIPVHVGESPVGALFYLDVPEGLPGPWESSVLPHLADWTGRVLTDSQATDRKLFNYLAKLRSLVAAMDDLSPGFHGHSDRMARYARWTAEEMGLSQDETESIALGAYFHDVGMVAIEPSLWLSPHLLDLSQRERLETHSLVGAEFLRPVPSSLSLAAMILTHHERFDGKGYPFGLSGTDIPIGGRILAAVDLFDALTSSRPHRGAVGFEGGTQAIQAATGHALDPQVAAALVAAWERRRLRVAPDTPAFRCWETKQASAHICHGCANRMNETVRCWDNPHHLCTRHGDTCATCIVFTEAQGRTLALQGTPQGGGA